MSETGERMVGGTELVESNDNSVGGESVVAASNHDVQRRVAIPRRAKCRRSGGYVNGRDIMEGVARGMRREKKKR